jgi:hypothetical protein
VCVLLRVELRASKLLEHAPSSKKFLSDGEHITKEEARERETTREKEE